MRSLLIHRTLVGNRASRVPLLFPTTRMGLYTSFASRNLRWPLEDQNNRFQLLLGVCLISYGLPHHILQIIIVWTFQAMLILVDKIYNASYEVSAQLDLCTTIIDNWPLQFSIIVAQRPSCADTSWGILNLVVLLWHLLKSKTAYLAQCVCPSPWPLEQPWP